MGEQGQGEKNRRIRTGRGPIPHRGAGPINSQFGGGIRGRDHRGAGSDCPHQRRYADGLFGGAQRHNVAHPRKSCRARHFKTPWWAILILLMVGALIGVWIASGVIPTVIYYGSLVLEPSVFYVASLVLCSIVSVAIGSSWTTAGTVGIALISIAGAMGLSLEMTAGAIISGAYFGDKLSPLSDTTNLASGLSGTELFKHIRFLLWTTIPAFVVALVFFTVASFSVTDAAPAEEMEIMRSTLAQEFSINGLLFIPLICMFLLAVRRIPPLVSIFLSIVIGGVMGAFFSGLGQRILVNCQRNRRTHTKVLVGRGYRVRTSERQCSAGTISSPVVA